MHTVMDERKRRIVEAFNVSADTYDHITRRFFDHHAEALVREAEIPSGARILDVATGTGKVALAAARAVGPRGHVVGIDLAPGMLARARRKVGDLPVEYREMDGEDLRFDDAAFDIVLCGFGATFFSDMVRAIREMYRVLRPGGRAALSWWIKEAFEPMGSRLRARLERYGLPVRPQPAEPWMILAEPVHLVVLLERGGFQQPRVVREALRFDLRQAEEYWGIIWSGSVRSSLSMLAPDALERFKQETLEDTERLRTATGIPLDTSTHIAVGVRPAPGAN